MDSEWFDRVFNPQIDDCEIFYSEVAAELGQDSLTDEQYRAAYAAKKVTIARFGSDV